MKYDKLHLLTINLNWDHRDRVCFYGRSRNEAVNLLGKWIEGEVIPQADGEGDGAPVPSLYLLRGPNGPGTWITLFHAYGRAIIQTEAEKLYKSEAEAEKLYESYEGDAVQDAIRVFLSFVKALGQWETIATTLADLPEWLTSGEKVHFNREARAKELEARETAAKVKRVKDEARARIEELEASIKPIPLGLADDPDLAQWPNIPDYKPANMGATEPGPEEAMIAPLPPEPSALLGREGSAVSFTFSPFLGHGLYTAVSLRYNAAGFGATPERAAIDMLENTRNALYNQALALANSPDPNDQRAAAIVVTGHMSKVLEELVQYRKAQGLDAPDPEQAPSFYVDLPTEEADPEPEPKRVPDCRPMHYLYIGKRGSSTYAWARVNPERQNDGRPLEEGPHDRRYFDGPRNLVPEATIGDIYTFYLSNGKDEVIGAPYVYHSLWNNLDDRLDWYRREGIATTGKE